MNRTVLSDRYSWLWFVLGALLLPFSHIQTVFALAPWLAPIFLIRFLRTQRKAVGMPALYLAYIVAAWISLRNGFLSPPPGFLLMLAICSGYALVLSLRYFADRLVAPRLSGIARTLVFPLASTVIDWLMIFGPFLTYGSPAYAQYGNLPLMQMVSLTGMWGLTFLVSWLGPVVNALWEQGFDLRRAWRVIAPFGVTLLAVLLYGSIRLAFFPPTGQTVLAAGITPDRDIWRYQPVEEIARGSETRREELRAETGPILDDLFLRTRQLAQAGVKVITWSETAVFVLQEDDAALMEQARRVAQEEGIYLQVGVMTVLRAEQHPYGQNRAVLFSPDGNQVWDYHKALPVVIGDAAEIAPGPGIVPAVDTEFGRLAAYICQDADLPGYARQAGQARAGILLAPYDDWVPIHFDHARMAVFRAVENGFSLIRATGKGYSLAADYQGRPLAFADYYGAPKSAAVAAIPMQGVTTLYSIIGDVFAYLSIAGFLGIVALAFIPRRSVVVQAVQAR